VEEPHLDNGVGRDVETSNVVEGVEVFLETIEGLDALPTEGGGDGRIDEDTLSSVPKRATAAM
jgi:hypothetical protein